MRFFRQAALAAFVAALAAAPVAEAQARKDQAVFDLSIRGIRAGTLSFSGSNDGGSYGVAGKLESTGLVAAIRKVRYDAKASGSMRGTRFVPRKYEETADTGKRQSQSVMEYRGGVPQVKVYSPPRDPEPTDVDPATQGGTVDPLTALYATLRDVPADQACKTRVTMFDGKRRSQIVLAAPVTEGDTITCAGEYRRLEGFTPEEMAEKQRFAFRLTYQPAGDGFVRVTEVAMDSLYGRASLTRR